MQVDKKILKNGLETIYINLPGCKVSSAQIWFRAGSSLEKGNDKGVAHFLEHMFFKGSKKRPGAKIAFEVESEGGEINAFTSFDYTCYFINATNDNLTQSADILLDMVANPTFLKKELIPEREVVLEEYKMSQDNPSQFGFQKLQSLCFEKGYKHPILGSTRTIKNFSREQITKFRKNFYNTSNSFLVVAGDLEKNQTKIDKVINKYKLPKGPRSEFSPFKLKSKPTLEIHEKDVKMANITIATQAPSIKDFNLPQEEIAVNILGHGESSYFYKSLVNETNWANTVAGSTLHLQDGGAHILKVIFPLENFEKISQKISDILKGCSEKGFQEDELTKIKNQFVSSKIFDLESIESFSFSVGHGYAMSGDLKFEENYIDQIRNVSPGNANKALQEILSRPFHISLQVPKGENSKGVEATAKNLLSNLNRSTSSSKNLEKPIKYKTLKGSQFDKTVKRISIADGVTLLYRQNDMTPTYACTSYIKGGLSSEDSDTNGIHHICSSLLTKGTEKLDQFEIKKLYEEKSTTLSGFSGRNAYGVSSHGLTESFETLFETYLDCLFTPTFPKQAFDHEIEYTLRQLESQQIDPIRTCFNLVNSTIFSEHPYSMNTLGTTSTLQKFDVDDVSNLHQENLKNNEILISLFGKFDLDLACRLIKERVSKISGRKPKKYQTTKIQPILENLAYKKMDREQTHIFYGIPIEKMGHAKNVLFKMITVHLSGMSSELFTEVRDKKGLCYNVQPIHFSALEGGYWGIYISTSNDKTVQAIEAIKEILDRLAKKGLTKTEFNRLKRVINGQECLSLQTNSDHANLYGLSALHGLNLDEYHLNLKRIEKMKYENFSKDLKKALSKKFNTIVVGESFPKN